MTELIEYRLNSSELVMNDLVEEIHNSNLKEGFEKEFEEEQAMMELKHYRYLEDIDRESAGTLSLSSFSDYVEKTIFENQEVTKILN